MKNDNYFSQNKNKPPSIPPIHAHLIVKIGALCEAVLYFTPNNDKTKKLLAIANELNNTIIHSPFDQKRLYRLAEKCDEEMTHLKNTLSNEWHDNLKPYIDAFSEHTERE